MELDLVNNVLLLLEMQTLKRRGEERSDHNVLPQPLLPLLYFARSNSNEVMEISPDISFAIRIVINFTFCSEDI